VEHFDQSGSLSDFVRHCRIDAKIFLPEGAAALIGAQGHSAGAQSRGMVAVGQIRECAPNAAGR